eukprot:COSAG06_NODE_41_length_30044_cov_24.608382_1_plen_45_part_00
MRATHRAFADFVNTTPTLNPSTQGPIVAVGENSGQFRLYGYKTT